MMNGKENQDVHCREVKEIFETKLPWIIRRGILVITLILLAGAVAVWLWKG